MLDADGSGTRSANNAAVNREQVAQRAAQRPAAPKAPVSRPTFMTIQQSNQAQLDAAAAAARAQERASAAQIQAQAKAEAAAIAKNAEERASAAQIQAQVKANAAAAAPIAKNAEERASAPQIQAQLEAQARADSAAFANREAAAYPEAAKARADIAALAKNAEERASAVRDSLQDSGQPIALSPSEPAGQPQQSVTVRPGDNLTAIAATHGTTVDAIVQANGISNPDFIRPGQELKLPEGASDAAPSASEPAGRPMQSLTVSVGDTLSEIAQKHGTTVDAIARANNISNPDIINPGQELKIPTSNVVTGSGEAYSIQAGDTLTAIAAAHGTTVDALVRDNNIIDPDKIYVGGKLNIPGGSETGDTSNTQPSFPPPTPEFTDPNKQ